MTFPANSQFVPPTVVTPYDTNGNWVGFGAGVVKNITATDQEYYASRPTPVQALFSMPQGGDRSQAARQLALQGYAIDDQIDAQAQSPMMMMYWRELYGFTWYPSALSAPILLAPGLSFPGLPNYDPKNPPPGALKVSVDSADYQPFTPVVPPPPPTVAGIIGPGLGLTSDQLTPQVLPSAQVWSSMATQHYTEGTEVTGKAPDGTEGKFMYHLLGNELMSAHQRVGVWIGPMTS